VIVGDARRTRSAVAPGSPKAPWKRGRHDERFKLKSCQPDCTSHREGAEMVAARSNPGESSGARCSGPANRSRQSEENSVSALEGG
jgi:hypothetical protein